jgi:hypothetical protein
MIFLDKLMSVTAVGKPASVSNKKGGTITPDHEDISIPRACWLSAQSLRLFEENARKHGGLICHQTRTLGGPTNIRACLQSGQNAMLSECPGLPCWQKKSKLLKSLHR